MSNEQFSRWDLGALVALVAWSVLPLAHLLLSAGEGDYFTGADGPFAADQLQYMAWIREAGEGFLIGNQFDLAPSADVFLHPMFVLSGLVWKLGASIQLAYLLWKPIAVAILFLGFRAYVRRFLGPEGGARMAGLWLALFYFAALAVLLDWGGLGGESARTQATGMAFESLTSGMLWGYLPTAIALGLMPVYLLGIERLLDPDRRRPGRGAAWYAGGIALTGGLVSWIHPWQGLILLGVTAGIVIVRQRWYDVRLLVAPLVGTVLPLTYYFALSLLDATWQAAEDQGAALAVTPSLWILVAGLAPLGLPALIGARGNGRDVGELGLRIWPLVALAGYFVAPGYSLHMLTGVTLPLAILAVRGWWSLRPPALLGAAAVLVLTIPGMAYIADGVREALDSGQQPNLLRGSEREALRYLEDHPAPGGVLSTAYFGLATPALSGRAVWVGHPTWTPDSSMRIAAAEDLFSGRDPAIADRLVRDSGARFVLASCRDAQAGLEFALGNLVYGARRFGCAAVFELRRPGRS